MWHDWQAISLVEPKRKVVALSNTKTSSRDLTQDWRCIWLFSWSIHQYRSAKGPDALQGIKLKHSLPSVEHYYSSLLSKGNRGKGWVMTKYSRTKIWNKNQWQREIYEVTNPNYVFKSPSVNEEQVWREVQQWVTTAVCKNDGGSVMVWSCNSASGVGDRVKNNGILNAEK